MDKVKEAIQEEPYCDNQYEQTARCSETNEDNKRDEFDSSVQHNEYSLAHADSDSEEPFTTDRIQAERNIITAKPSVEDLKAELNAMNLI